MEKLKSKQFLIGKTTIITSVGWDYHERIRGCLLHIDIKDHKIWIQHDGTKDSIADELVAKWCSKRRHRLGLSCAIQTKID
jgi:hypothetical protein